MEILALIIARGGSKSIPHKNILELAGFPLIAYSIAAAKASQLVSRVIVSTDDEQIASTARQFGAETPFMRPAELAQDDTPDLPVFQHALEWLAQHEDYSPQIVVQLRPTSPFRKVEHINRAVEILIEHPEADSVRTVCVPFQNPFKMWLIGEHGYMKPLIPHVPNLPAAYSANEKQEPYNLPRQVLPEVYWQTGYVDAIWSDTIMQKLSMSGERILPLIIDAKDWVDIDSFDDWQRAEQRIKSGEISLDDLGFSFSGI